MGEILGVVSRIGGDMLPEGECNWLVAEEAFKRIAHAADYFTCVVAWREVKASIAAF
jgi:hypothetical protein